jgi:predicted lipoprotein with Yx(FWY)xxD motif
MEVQMKALRFAVYGILGGLLVACGSSTATTATTSPTPKGTVVIVTKTDATHGTFLVAASNQMTLYTFTKDTPGVSACTSSGCVKSWPLLSVTAGTVIAAGPGITGQLSTISRADGVTQVTYKGLPLYFYYKDVAVGDVTGVYTNWELAKP